MQNIYFAFFYIILIDILSYTICYINIDLKSTTKRVWSAPAAASAAGEVSSSLLGIKSKW